MSDSQKQSVRKADNGKSYTGKVLEMTENLTTSSSRGGMSY